ncbi:hypothetical protein CWATWH0005_3280 [Crocosphaera watsonii WH 0005]|uniref:Uncharacterized protein n=1 Tax=Crocosphaera watsonii WH 0005 TaxID=423472 RepID=T2IK49_CROWT|nr:hypothetical protein [Crocosphaera watsonii]CCQ53916.1 hypothetical protein CWATWH0005_3280 [Crocosphaera watsonii WH 0005]
MGLTQEPPLPPTPQEPRLTRAFRAKPTQYWGSTAVDPYCLGFHPWIFLAQYFR